MKVYQEGIVKGVVSTWSLEWPVLVSDAVVEMKLSRVVKALACHIEKPDSCHTGVRDF